MTDPVSETQLKITYADDEYIGGIISDAGGNPIDLTLAGTLVEFVVRKYLEDADAARILYKNIGAGITVGSDGSYTVSIADSDSSALKIGSYFYTLYYTDPSGLKTSVARGKLVVVFNAAIEA